MSSCLEWIPRPRESLAFYKAESKKGIAKLKEMIKPKITSKKKLIGKYRSRELGNLKVFERKGKLLADFGEFTSEIKEKVDAGKKRVFLLTSPPWTGSVPMIQDKDGFTIDAAQQKYQFKRL